MRFYDFFQGVCGKSHICTVSVHAAILKVTVVYEDVHKIVIKLAYAVWRTGKRNSQFVMEI
jgi:hypothetical protein